MGISSNKFTVRAIVEFVALATILSLIGYYFYCKIDHILIESVKDAVALQSQSIAYGLNERFQHKLDELQTRTELLQKKQFPAEELLDIATIGTKKGRDRGILHEDNSTIAGESLPDEIFKSIYPRAFKEKKQTIDYLQGKGLVFVVPFEYEGETCVIYELFNDEAVQTFYKVKWYNDNGTLILAKTYDNWIMLAEGLYPELTGEDYPPAYDEVRYKGYDKYAVEHMENFDDTWAELEHSTLVEGKTNTFFADNGIDAFFFFCTFISAENHLVLSGYVEWDDVVVGNDYIYTIMKMMFAVILLMTFFGVRYHIRTQEAKYLEHEKILANSANKAKTDFLSNMSHEIRTPINAIIGMDEMILRESKEEDTLEYAHNLQNAARNLLGLINDILDLSKIEAGKMEIIPVEYQLSSVLNDLVNMIQKRAEDKGLEFNIKADKDIPNALFGDEIRIKQIVTNLLTNAVKYTEKGSVTLKVTYNPVDESNIYLCISVADTGIGIKEEDIQKLFSAFERIEEERNRMIEGTGLGMNITEQLLEMMGAELKVKSVYGEGSNFSFQVKQRVISPEPIGDFEEAYRRSLAQHKVYRESFTAPNAQILIVDDTEMNLVVIKGLLKQTKIKIDTATSGKECLKMVKRQKYDIIFLDHMMPGMDGIETLQTMKNLSENLNENTPTISLTANAISGAREQYIAAGFRDYLTKPIDYNQLEKLMIKYLPKDKIIIADGKDTSESSITSAEVSLPDWLKNVDNLDVNEGIAHCGNIDAYLNALTAFAESITPSSNDIEKYFKAEDWKNYTTKVHALKSTSKVIGAAELSEKAKRLEDAGNSGYIDEIQQDTEPLLKLYRSYADKLQPLIKSDSEDTDKPLIDDTELAEAFGAIKDIATSFDYDSLMFVFQSLDEYRLPNSEAERYKKIKEAAAKLDWETINSLLK